MYYIEHTFECQYFFEEKSNKYSEYVFAFCHRLCYDKYNVKDKRHSERIRLILWHMVR